MNVSKEYEILLPNGMITKVDCVEHTTNLCSLKDMIWREKIKSDAAASLESKNHFLFCGILHDGSEEEFWNEERILANLNLGVKTLRLEMKENLDTTIKIIDEEVGICIGMSTQKLAELSSSFSEVLNFRYSMLSYLRENTLSLCQEDESLISYIHTAPKDPKLSYMTQKSLDCKDDLSIKVSFSMECNLPGLSTLKPSIIRVSTESTVSDAWKKIRQEFHFENNADLLTSFTLRVCCTDVFLLDLKEKLVSYQYFQLCILNNVVPVLQVEHMRVLEPSCDSSEMFIFCSHYEDLLQNYCKSKLRKNSHSSRASCVQNSEELFQLKIVELELNIFKGKPFEKIFVKSGIYFGSQIISDLWESDYIKLETKNVVYKHEFDISISNIPRGSKLCISVCRKIQTKKLTNSIPIGWINVNIFNIDDSVISGVLRLPLLNILDCYDSLTLLNSEGESYDYDLLSSLSDDDNKFITLHAELCATLMYYIESPLRFEKNSAQLMKKLGISNSIINKQQTSEILEKIKKITDTISLSDEITEQDKEFIWSYQTLCPQYPASLYALIMSVNWIKRDNVKQVYQLLRSWPCISTEVSLKILSFKCPDPEVLRFSMECLRSTLSYVDICNYMLPLIQSINALPFENVITQILLKSAIENIDVALLLFWNLKCYTLNKLQRIRFSLIQDVLCRSCPPLFKIVYRQTEAANILAYIYDTVSTHKNKFSKVKLLLESPLIKASLENIVSPVNRMHTLDELLPNSCGIKNSKKSPLYMSWTIGVKSVIPHHQTGHLLWKIGDDLRQDGFIIGILKTFDKLWRQNGHNFHMVTYSCITTHANKGMIEIVPGACTLMEIQQETLSGAMQMSKMALYDWLAKNNRGNALDKALDIFTKSCVAFTVCGFIMGIRDRHNDNIMVTTYGQIFHIDFGHILNNRKRKFGVLRERTPLLLTQDILYVISRGNKKPLDSDFFLSFLNLCRKAYKIIRQHHHLLEALFRLMMGGQLPELRLEKDLQYLAKSLALDKSEAGALEFFEKQIFDSIKKEWTIRADWLAHWIKKKND